MHSWKMDQAAEADVAASIGVPQSGGAQSVLKILLTADDFKSRLKGFS